MSNGIDRITVLQSFDDAHRDMPGLFVAAKAECTVYQDKHQILAIIEHAFGELRPFNRVVRNIFAQVARPALPSV